MAAVTWGRARVAGTTNVGQPVCTASRRSRLAPSLSPPTIRMRADSTWSCGRRSCPRRRLTKRSEASWRAVRLDRRHRTARGSMLESIPPVASHRPSSPRARRARGSAARRQISQQSHGFTRPEQRGCGLPRSHNGPLDLESRFPRPPLDDQREADVVVHPVDRLDLSHPLEQSTRPRGHAQAQVRPPGKPEGGRWWDRFRGRAATGAQPRRGGQNPGIRGVPSKRLGLSSVVRRNASTVGGEQVGCRSSLDPRALARIEVRIQCTCGLPGDLIVIAHYQKACTRSASPATRRATSDPPGRPTGSRSPSRVSGTETQIST